MVEWARGNGVEAQSFWPFAVAAGSVATLLKGTGRRTAARGATYLACGLLVAVGIWTGIPQAAHLVHGESVDWLDLTIGVLVVLFVGVGAMTWIAGRKQGGAASPSAE
ncbi:hypothetical protein [Streptomyces beijiangensis]